MIKVDYRETLQVYLRAESTQEAAQTLKVSQTVLAQRLSKMRAAGVNVPKKTVKLQLSSKLYVAQLNSLVAKHVKESA